ncbi:MAG: hypothetical protein DRI71_07435 [Bacteroidetes bacterium]|nr:MAG: hypothetical protein DRI71_07435 [Bacteroidota bacterium]
MSSQLARFFVTAIFFLLANLSWAQDLAKIGGENPIHLSGGVSLNQVFYASSNQENRRDPFNYYLGGQLTLDIYGLSLPFAFTYSNQQSQFRQPFNQFSVHPTYKWVTGHFGYTSASYSPYTLNGHIFEGAAIDLKPGDKWDIGVMYGRLQKSVVSDTTDTNALPSAFERWGYSVKLKYGDQLNYAKLILFKSWDEAGSLPPINLNEELKPEENLVASLGFSKQLFKKLVLQGEYASSALTRDVTSPEINDSSEPLANLGGLFTPRTSSAFYNAYNAAINYNAKTYSVGVRYERVGSGYQTHGAYYFNSDFYNLSANTNLSLLRGKAKVTASLGMQEDNLENTKVSGTKRLVGSMGLGISASERLNFNVGYSNYTTFTNINRDYIDITFLTPYDRLDTLNYSQVAQNANLGMNYVISRKKNVSQSVMANFTLMETHDVQADIPQPSGSIFYTFNGGYIHSIMSIGLSISAMLNMQMNDDELGTKVIGPAMSISKMMFNKTMRTSFAIAYNNVQSGNTTGSTINGRAILSYRLKKSHSFQVSAIAVQRQRGGETASKASDFTGTLGYNFSF